MRVDSCRQHYAARKRLRSFCKRGCRLQCRARLRYFHVPVARTDSGAGLLIRFMRVQIEAPASMQNALRGGGAALCATHSAGDTMDGRQIQVGCTSLENWITRDSRERGALPRPSATSLCSSRQQTVALASNESSAGAIAAPTAMQFALRG